jgi:NADPH:quinone reductase-like Zn-dependent oxidoreductase
MKALTVSPSHANTVRLDDVPEHPASNGSILVQTHAVGIVRRRVTNRTVSIHWMECRACL